GLTPTSFSLANGGTQTYTGVNPGSGYNVSETVPTNWGLISSSCDNGSAVSNISVNAGQTVTCTFTNGLKPTLTVTKACVPTTDSGKFDLKIGATVKKADATCTAGISGTDNTTGAVVLDPNTYTVSEAAGTGTNLSHYDTSIGGDCTSGGSVTLAYGDNKTCTITNTRRKFTIVTYVCETTSGTPALYKSSVLLPDPGGSSKTTETAVPSGTSASAICGLAANYPNLNTGTFTG